MVFRLVTIIVLLAAGSSVFGASSGLNNIPTADIIPSGALSVEGERSSEKAHTLDNADTSLLMQVGVGRGLELGLDICGDGDECDNVWNAKYAISYGDGEPVIAIGLQNVGSNQKSQPYLVGWRPLGRGRLHLGAIRTEGHVRPMIGYDVRLGLHVTMQADYTVGEENLGSLGFCVDLGRDFAATAAALRNNSGSDRMSYILTVGWYQGQ